MQTVIFDVDDTLYDQLQPFHKAVDQQLDQPMTDEMVEVLYKASRKYSDDMFDKHMSGEITALDLQTYRIIRACDDVGVALSYEEAVAFQEAYLSEQRKIKLLKPMRHLLEALSKANIQLAILTNGETDHQMRKIKQLGVSNWIPEKHIFISGEIGYSKPSVETFKYIEDQIEINRETTIYIGDSFENDIIGAYHAGWKSIWCNHRNRKPTQTDIKADYMINNPEEILSIMSQIIDMKIWSETR